MGAALRLMTCSPAAKKWEREERRRRDWSGLPDPALFSIAMDLSAGSLADVLAFGGVCKTWRSVAKDNDRALMSSLPPMVYREATADFFCPADGRVYGNRRLTAFLLKQDGLLPISGCSFGHLIVHHFVDDAKTTKAFSILNPLTGACARQFSSESPDPVVWAALSSHPLSPDCSLWIFCGHKVKFFDPTARGAWEELSFDVNYYISPPAFLQNLVYIGMSSTKTQELRSSASGAGLEILKVRLNRDGTSRRIQKFRVHTLDSAEERWAEAHGLRPREPAWDSAVDKWVRVRSLGDRALFWDGYGITVSNNPGRWGGSRDCIYFVDEEDGNKLGVFHFKDETLECPARVSPSNPELLRMQSMEYAWIHPSLCYKV